MTQDEIDPVCPECKAVVLYECVACSSNNYPPQRTWVGLTEEDRYEFAAAQYSWEELLVAAEAKLKEKNT